MCLRGHGSALLRFSMSRNTRVAEVSTPRARQLQRRRVQGSGSELPLCSEANAAASAESGGSVESDEPAHLRVVDAPDADAELALLGLLPFDRELLHLRSSLQDNRKGIEPGWAAHVASTLMPSGGRRARPMLAGSSGHRWCRYRTWSDVVRVVACRERLGDRGAGRERYFRCDVAGQGRTCGARDAVRRR
jgi:hypothetical protein